MSRFKMHLRTLNGMFSFLVEGLSQFLKKGLNDIHKIVLNTKLRRFSFFHKFFNSFFRIKLSKKQEFSNFLGKKTHDKESAPSNESALHFQWMKDVFLGD